MREIAFAHRKARIWLDEPPPYGATERTSTKIIEARGCSLTHRASPRTAAIEWFRFTGTFNYAMLGGDFTPSSTPTLRVIIPISPAPGPLITTSLLGTTPGEHIHAGLPEEFIKGPEQALRTLESSETPMPAGTLTLTHAAHSTIASNVWAFTQAMVCLVALIQAEPPDLDDEALRAMLSDPGRRRAQPSKQRSDLHHKRDESGNRAVCDVTGLTAGHD